MEEINTFVIAGVPRCGKSIFRKRVLEEYRVAGITTDLLRDGLTEGVPEFGLKREGQSDRQKAEILWPFWEGILIARHYYRDKLLIEGVNFLPKHLAGLKNKDYLKICFVGYPHTGPEEQLRRIKEHTSPDDNWHSTLGDTQLLRLIKIWIEDSLYFEEECRKYGLKFVDLSGQFEKGWKEVERFFFG